MASKSATDRLPVQKGDRVRYARDAKEGSTFQKGDILTITDHNHPFYWAKNRHGEAGLFYSTELELYVANSSR